MIDNAALKISYDFPFFSDEELEEVFQAHEKVYYQKGDVMLFHKIPNLAEWGRAWMSQKLFEYKQRSVEMFTLSATKRYMNLLEQKTQVVQFAPLKQIASYLGVTDTSLSRIRKELVSHPIKK